MKAAQIEVLDLKQRANGAIVATSCRYISERPSDSVRIRWDITSNADGFFSLKDVLYAEQLEGWKCESARVAVTALGDDRFKFFDDAHPDGVLICLILPTGYVTGDFGEFSPLPHGAKQLHARCAVLWRLDRGQSRVTWSMRKSHGEDIAELIQRFNQQIDCQLPCSSTPAKTDDTKIIEIKMSNEDSKGLHEAKNRPPVGPTEWLVRAVKEIPPLVYVFGVIALSAAAAVSSSFFFGNWIFAVYGGVATLIATILVRLYAAFKPQNASINVGVPMTVILWTCVCAFVFVTALGLFKLVTVTFPPDHSSQGVGSQKSAAPNPLKKQ